MTSMRLLTYLILVVLIVATGASQAVDWMAVTPPVGDAADSLSHAGTDGTNLFLISGNNQFFRLDYDPNDWMGGTWTQLADPSRNVCAWGSYSDLAYQSGYFYTIAEANNGGNTILRYKIATDTWEVWQDKAGQDLNIANTTNALHMDPARPGVGYAVWHAGGYWVQFDWYAQTADNSWMSTGNLGVSDAGWISRNEDVAFNGKTNTYFATKNDWVAGLLPNPSNGRPCGDIVYTWTGTAKGTAPTMLVEKPWQAGFGQSIEFIPADISPSGHDELWMVRGSDSAAADGPWEGSGDPTSDWAILDLSNVSAGWVSTASTSNPLDPLMDSVGYSGEIILVGNTVFVKGTNMVMAATLGTPATHSSISIGTAKAKNVGDAVVVDGIGTAAFTSDAAPKRYLESASRASAIQVRYGATAPALGIPLVVSGTIAKDTATNEKYIQATDWWVAGVQQTVTPVGATLATLGGDTGLKSVGLLVRVAGKVTNVDPSGKFIYISDGSTTAEADGVRIDTSGVLPTSIPTFRTDDFAMVTGISTKYAGTGGTVYPQVRLRYSADLTKVRTKPQQVNWTKITGPVTESYTKINRIGTDGNSLFCYFGQQDTNPKDKFWKYDFTLDPVNGTWTKLADLPEVYKEDGSLWASRLMTVGHSGGNSGPLAYQDGYLYSVSGTLADYNYMFNGTSTGWHNTFVRYNITTNTWESVKDPAHPECDLIAVSSDSGVAQVMDSAHPGRLVSVWHAGGSWVEFDWNTKAFDNAWISTSNSLNSEGVLNAAWVSRNEDVTTDGAGRYYSTHNDWTAGLSAGDVIYYFDGLAKQSTASGTTLCHKLTQKPWQSGYGQSITFVPGSISPSGNDELWMVRGTSGDTPNEGWGNPTSDYARYDIATGQWIDIDSLPGNVGYTGRIVLVNGSVFVRGTGDAWYVAKLN
jgi:hypothetical protein